MKLFSNICMNIYYPERWFLLVSRVLLRGFSCLKIIFPCHCAYLGLQDLGSCLRKAPRDIFYCNRCNINKRNWIKLIFFDHGSLSHPYFEVDSSILKHNYKHFGEDYLCEHWRTGWWITLSSRCFRKYPTHHNSDIGFTKSTYLHSSLQGVNLFIFKWIKIFWLEISLHLNWILPEACCYSPPRSILHDYEAFKSSRGDIM